MDFSFTEEQQTISKLARELFERRASPERGIGIDITYPLHRYFLWATHIELTLGSACQQLAQLGSAYSEGRR